MNKYRVTVYFDTLEKVEADVQADSIVTAQIEGIHIARQASCGNITKVDIKRISGKP